MVLEHNTVRSGAAPSSLLSAAPSSLLRAAAHLLPLCPAP